MKAIKLIMAALAAAVVFSCAEKADPEESGRKDIPVAQDPALVPGELNVKFSEEMLSGIKADLAKGNFLGTKSSMLNNVFSGMEVMSVERIFPDAGEFEALHRKVGLDRWYRVIYNSTVEQSKATGDISMIGGVEITEPVRRARPMGTSIFNDPMLKDQWHYYNDGSKTEWKAGCDINVLPVWEEYTTGSSNVIVSVVDGGIDLTHEDLKSAVIAGGVSGSRNFVDNNYTIVPHDHGTHVAGTIGAVNNNGKGVCGIAGGNNGKGGVRLMSCQVFKTVDGKDHSGNFEAAIVWGADHGAVISQNSWGHVYKTPEEASKGSVGGALKDAIDYFITYAGCDSQGNQRPDSPMKGGLVMFSAGNDAWPDGWPAEYSAKQPMCIAVGSSSALGNRAYYSNYGSWVNIAAPGGDVNAGAMILSTLPGNSYGYMQGTSMACPHVSGVAALVLSYCGGPGFTNEMLREKLIKGANPNILSKNANIGPMVDAMGAIAYGSDDKPDPVTNFSVEAPSNVLKYTWKVTKTEKGKKTFAYILLASTDKNAVDNVEISELGKQDKVKYVTLETGDVKVGGEMTGEIPEMSFATTYYATIVGMGYGKIYSDRPMSKAVTTGENHKPVIAPEKDADYKVKSHLTLDVVYHIYDPDGHPVTVKFDAGSKAATSTAIGDDRYKLTIVGNDDNPGKYQAKYTATDSYGAKSECVIEYELLENHPPKVLKPIENKFFDAPGKKLSLDMSEYFTDEDGEQLTYTVNMTPAGIVKLNQVGNVVNFTALDYGMTSVNIKAVDAKGQKDPKVSPPAVQSIKVLVRKADAAPDIYPNPVQDYLKVSDGSSKDLSVIISTSNGAVVFEKTGKGDAFDPMVVDMRGYAPGRYSLSLTADGRTTTRTIVKL